MAAMRCIDSMPQAPAGFVWSTVDELGWGLAAESPTHGTHYVGPELDTPMGAQVADAAEPEAPEADAIDMPDVGLDELKMGAMEAAEAAEAAEPEAPEADAIDMPDIGLDELKMGAMEAAEAAEAAEPEAREAAPTSSIDVAKLIGIPIANKGLSVQQQLALLNHPDTTVFLRMPVEPVTGTKDQEKSGLFAEAVTMANAGDLSSSGGRVREAMEMLAS